MRKRRSCLNPLHCGAVVASRILAAMAEATYVSQSPSLRGSGRFAPGAGRRSGGDASQSPSLRGSGRFKCEADAGALLTRLVSIPFIAGQWSLRVGPVAVQRSQAHVSIPFIAGQWSLRMVFSGSVSGGTSLNPLHCGAVVASRRGARRKPKRGRRSQSPSLRGSGRFARGNVGPPAVWQGSQSPSLRGSGRFFGP